MMVARQNTGVAWAAFSSGVLRFLDVILHLGAHRTGTTTLQMYLEGNRDNLNQIGMEFWGPKRTRAGLFSGLVKNPRNLTHDATLRGTRSSRLIKMEMDRLQKSGVRSLIVSEENMIGSMRDNMSLAQLYPDAKDRLERFAGAFGFGCKRVVLSIRSYEKYWASVLAFMVVRGWAAPDTAALDRLVTQPRRWQDVIKEVASVFPSAELVIWPFEGLVGQPEKQLALMNGQYSLPQTRGRREWHNASAGSAKIRQILRDRCDFARADALPEDCARWQPFDAPHIAALCAQYDEDIAWLRGGADGIATYIENSDSRSAGTHLRPAKPERGHFHDQQETGVG